MKTITKTIIPLLALALTSTTHAQSLGDVPACASGPALNSFASTGCPLTDIPCICKNQGFLTSLLPIIQAACSPEDLQKTVGFTEKLCADNGVPLSISASAPAPTAATETTMTMASGTAPAASASGTGSLNGGNSTGGTLTSPTPSPAPAPVNGAGALWVNMGLLVGGLLAGAAVLS